MKKYLLPLILILIFSVSFIIGDAQNPIDNNEIVSKRTENSKTFDLGNGCRRFVAQIGTVHYKDNYADKTEKWKDIDLNWEGNRITKAPYELTHEGNKLTLRDKKTGKVTIIELDSIGGKKIPNVAWERSKGLARSPGIITIDNIALDTDLEIVVEFSAIRFRRILKSDKAPQEAKFKVTGGTSLISIRASDDEGDIPVATSFKGGILIETLNPDRTIKYPVRIDPTWQVVASTDDCYRRLATDYFALTYGSMRVGADGATVYQIGGGMRFTNITIPQGTVIDTAYLTLRCSVSRSITTVNSRISAEDVDDAPTFTDNKVVFDDRWANRTTARVNWDNIPNWTFGVDYNSPEIKTVIKEIVDREGWNSGQDIVIFWEDFDDRSTPHVDDCVRIAESYDSSSTYAPKLVIEYPTPEINVIFFSTPF